jgi:cohesin complex subunit SA-1/2
MGKYLIYFIHSRSLNWCLLPSVFVHRYRDLDPHIRAECVRAMGHWFTHYPAHFLDASYLRYVGWVLSDSATPVRLEAVRALSAVYAQAEYIGGLMNFTARFKPRLLEMAARDTELAVRTAVLGVLGAVDQHGLLEDGEREQMCQLVFDGEVRVRKAVAGFVGGLWNELVEERLAGRKVGEKGKERAGAKALAMLLVRWDRERVEEEDGSQDGSQRGVTMSTDIKGRTALAVEALWDDVDSASGWEGLLEMLLLDHSAGGGEEDLDAADDSIAASAKNTVDEAWRLTETEESVLLEVLIASLRRAKTFAGTAKKVSASGYQV